MGGERGVKLMGCLRGAIAPLYLKGWWVGKDKKWGEKAECYYLLFIDSRGVVE